MVVSGLKVGKTGGAKLEVDVMTGPHLPNNVDPVTNSTSAAQAKALQVGHRHLTTVSVLDVAAKQDWQVHTGRYKYCARSRTKGYSPPPDLGRWGRPIISAGSRPMTN